MKRVNIQKDVESRNKIATSTPQETVSNNPETVSENAQIQENQLQESQLQERDQASSPVEVSQKRGRKTKGDTQEISL